MNIIIMGKCGSDPKMTISGMCFKPVRSFKFFEVCILSLWGNGMYAGSFDNQSTCICYYQVRWYGIRDLSMLSDIGYRRLPSMCWAVYSVLLAASLYSEVLPSWTTMLWRHILQKPLKRDTLCSMIKVWWISQFQFTPQCIVSNQYYISIWTWALTPICHELLHCLK